MAPWRTSSLGAEGRSTTRCSTEIDDMPSLTVPMFSNSAETSHRIHCDMPPNRSTNPMAIATAPIWMAEVTQRWSATALTDTSRSAFRAYGEAQNCVTRRICR